MTPSHAIAPRRFARRRGVVDPAELRSTLAPVVTALLASAAAEAASIDAKAAEEARRVVSVAREEADEMIAAARREGNAVVTQAVSAELAAARRAAEECVLAARSGVYSSVRSAAVRALEREAETPSGRRLAGAVAGDLGGRLGKGAIVTRGSGFTMRAQLGNRGLTLRTADLIDAALRRHGWEMQRLYGISPVQ